MKKGAWLLCISFLLWILPQVGLGQVCIYGDNISNFSADQWCSPVRVINWTLSYTEVENDGGTVTIFFDWGDGNTQFEPTVENPAGTFTASANHIYFSENNLCKYYATASMVIDGELCENSTVEKNVPVWDTDNKNGANVSASPNVYPICVGNGATMRFSDGTTFNCVPPQEDDIPNNRTRWIQWVYGTNHTDPNFMTGTPVSVDGYTGPWPYEGPVITLTEPVYGSNEQSLPITVANDKLIGEEFEVELRYWNYCNPYLPGMPEEPAEIDRSVIRIVGNPDATIAPVDTMCEYNDPVILVAADGGGTWDGNGITNRFTGQFTPATAGAGSHEVTYEITDGNGCYDADTAEVIVRPAPVGDITPVDVFCIYDPPYDLESTPAGGSWSGDGITDTATGIFDPAVAGPGGHEVTFTTETDAYGCFGVATELVRVADVPQAEILTPDSAWCAREENRTMAEVLISGTDTSSFDLIFLRRGVEDTLFNLSAGVATVELDNQVGRNEYILKGVIEHHGSTFCDTDLSDTLVMDVYPYPDMTISATQDDWCSPVNIPFYAVPGYNKYYWKFGDGDSTLTRSSAVQHTYFITAEDSLIMVIDTIDQVIDTSYYPYVPMDTVYSYQIIIETSFGCRDTTSGTVKLYQNPDADFFVSPETQAYPDSKVFLLNASSYGDWDYEWDFGDGNQSSLRSPKEHVYDTWGVYDIGLKVSNEQCRDSMTRQVQILPPPPIALFEPDTAGCPPLEVTFENSSQYADSYIWDFDDGQFSTEKNPTHTFYESKAHHIKLTAYGLSGTDTTRQTIYIHPRPNAVFDVYPKNARNLSQVFKFVNNSSDGAYYLWDFGDGTTSPDEDASHVYGKTGTYTVTLYAWSDEGCPDTLVRENILSVVAGEGNTKFPNAFVWNGSGPTGGHWKEGTIDNTVFHPNLENAVELRMIIYTRWGEKVFQTDELYVGWDGYLKNGRLASQGVYVFKAWVTYVDGRQELLTGDVTFLH